MEITIYGYGSLGLQAKNIAERNGWEVKAFIDDNKEKKSELNSSNLPILRIEEYLKINEFPNSILIAINNPVSRKNVRKKLDNLNNFNYPSLIDKDAILLGNNEVSNGSIVFPGTIIDVNTFIGNHCILNKLCSIGHDVKIEDYVTISPLVMVGGNTQISKNVYIGASASLRENISITENTTIGMGSVVVKPIKIEGIYFGNPAVIK